MDDWWNRANCRGQDPYLWDLDVATEASIRLAMRFCWACPVRVQCEWEAVERGSTGVIQGGRKFATKAPKKKAAA